MLKNAFTDAIIQWPYFKQAIGLGVGALGIAGAGLCSQQFIYSYHDRKLQKEGVLLKVLPKENVSLKETEKLIKNIHSMLLNTKFRKLQYGRPYMSFEISGRQGSINFYIWVPKDMKDRVIDRIYASYPEIAIELVEDYIPAYKDTKYYSAELVLGYHHTLKVKNKSEQDILGSIISGMKDLSKGEFAAVQVICRPIDNSWQKKGRRELERFERSGIRPGQGSSSGSDFLGKLGESLEVGAKAIDKELAYQKLDLVTFSDFFSSGSDGGSRKSKFDRKEITVAAEKLMEPGFETVIRVVSMGKYKKGNTARVKAMSAAFNELDSENRFKKDFNFSHKKTLELFKKRQPYLYGKNNILTPSELSNFFLRLPGRELIYKFKDIESISIKQFAPPEGCKASGKGVVFAKNTYRGEDTLIEIKDKDLVRHVVVQGKTGTGKSEWSKTIFLNHIKNIRDENGNIIRKGRGAMLLEPHGKLADEILQIIPEDRRKDVIFFDLFSDYPWPFNFCNVPDRECEELTKEQIVQKTVDEAIEIFKRTFSDVWSEKNEYFITNAIKAVIDTGHTMVELPRMFSDKGFRNSVIPHIQNSKVKKFFVTKFKENAQGKIDSSTESTASSVEYKLEKFLNSKELVRALGQNGCIDFKDILDNDKIIIFKLSKDRMSQDRINFIGGIAMKLLIVGAFARSKSKWDDPFLVLVDEAQNFINESFKDIYYELRKYGVSLVLMHQELEQLNKVSGLVNAIYNNVGTSITFTVGDLDAPFFENKYGPRVDQYDLKNLPSRYGYCKLLVKGKTSDTFNIYSLDRPEVPADEAQRSVNEIIENNKKGKIHCDEIDKIIMSRFEDEDSQGFMEDENIAFAMAAEEIERVENDNKNDKLEEEHKNEEKSIWDD